MEYVNTIKKYLKVLQAGDEEEILNLFHPDAMLTSARTGRVDVKSFFTGLFSQLKTSEIDLKQIFVVPDDPTAYAAHFLYNWELIDGSKAGLVCVDLIKFDQATKKIKQLDVVAYPLNG